MSCFGCCGRQAVTGVLQASFSAALRRRTYFCPRLKEDSSGGRGSACQPVRRWRCVGVAAGSGLLFLVAGREGRPRGRKEQESPAVCRPTEKNTGGV